MVTQTEKLNSLITDYFEKEQKLGAQLPEWMKELRQQGLSRFNELGIPTIKNEEWKYTNLSSLAERKFYIPEPQPFKELGELHEYLDPAEINVVFVNGDFHPKLSNLTDLPKGVSIVNLTTASAPGIQPFETHIREYQQKFSDPFAALNDAITHGGVLVKIDEKTVLKRLIHIVHVTCVPKENAILSPRTLIVLGKSAQAEVLETYMSCTPVGYFTNALTDIFLEENSVLRYTKAQNEGRQAYHIGTTRIFQKRDSLSENFSMTTGGMLTRNNLMIILENSGANTFLNGLYAVQGEQHVDNHTCVDHQAPNATSNQYYKGILNGNSHAVFNGKIFVKRIAQQTNSYQLNKNLLLGKGARVDTKPQLEIFADDVKCTHGATIGQLNEDELFYLETRGIHRELAVRMLCRGFVDDILNRISNPSVVAKLNKMLAPSFETFK